jgi:Fic family protein
MYIWQQARWPEFSWDVRTLASPLADTHKEQGRLLGRMEALGFESRSDARLLALTQEVTKSSEIEGETLDADQVRSSIARRLGLDIAGLVPSDRHVDGAVEVVLDATQNFHEPLTRERLFTWHTTLFPTGGRDMKAIRVGAWRNDDTGPMRVVSGPIGRERVHFEAPPASRLENEMNRFLEWFNEPAEADPLLHASLAHLWFVTVHPFDDGNGRIARAVADMALARAENSTQRYYSMSAQIRAERNDYYRELESAQKATLDITRWHAWFLGCLVRAITGAQEKLGAVLDKARFWERFARAPLNERQILVLNRVLDDGFEGKLTTSKWAKLAKCSQDTAYRDVLDLLGRGVLVKNPEGGRSTSYSLAAVSREHGLK